MTAPTNPSPVVIDSDEAYIPLTGNPHLRLTPWRESDLDDAMILFNSPEVGKWARSRPYPFTPADAQTTIFSLLPATYSYLTTLRALYPSPPPFPTERIFPFGALRDMQTGHLVGRALVAQSKQIEGAWEVAYDLLPAYWGKGVGTGMLRAMLTYAKWLGVNRMIAHCEAPNLASGAILRKSGFIKIEEMEVDWPEDKGGGKRQAHRYQMFLQEAPGSA
ncbi:hypothetical protein IAT38_004969 [Cryptococcus sp. DSM 104549]